MSEVNFHVLVVAPLRASDDHAMNPPWSAPVRFERASFDEAMASVAPRLVIDVPDPTAARGEGGKSVRLELQFDAMRSFKPDVLAASVPLLAALVCGAHETTSRRSVSLRDSAPATAPSANASLLDDILSGMESPGSSRAGLGLGGALANVLANEEVQNLERAWRGLHFLVSRASSTSERSERGVLTTSERTIAVSAIAATADEVDGVLERLARATDADPIDLVLVDHALGSTHRDLDRVASWAARAEALGAPLVANGLPELVGEADLSALGRSQRRLRSSDDPRAAAVRAIAARDVTRWIALALNGAIARPRHRGVVPRLPGVTLDESAELYLGPAMMVGALAADSVQRTGWACALSGPTNGAVRDLPVHVEDGSGTPLEALASEATAAEAAAAGLMLFASVANKDVAILAHAPTLYRGAATTGGAPPAAAHGLVDQIFVARIARAIVQLAAAIPGDTPPSAVAEVAKLALTELFGDAPRRPEVEIAVGGVPPCLEVTVRPRGFHGVRLEEVTLGAPLG
jgi:hypothetical protein